MNSTPDITTDQLDNNLEKVYTEKVLKDFRIACLSREASLLGRKEVLTGKAKFGILGDGKEIPQIALAHFFNKGDFRSGYYRDQTWMLALGVTNLEQYFAQLYADSDNDPFSKGRQMNNHYATAFKDDNDNWLNHTERYNVSSDISSTGGQMARAFGLATASKKYRAMAAADPDNNFSDNGNEISFCSIGDASTSEGIFWETLNAASVSEVPLIALVWDDGYGISVPIELQTTKGSISKAVEGFRVDEESGNGLRIYNVKAWDYAGLMKVYSEATRLTRKDHRPALIHVTECTQPQGHSTSGSHERYKSQERLQWEKEYDGIKKMAEWIIESNMATEAELDNIREEAKKEAKAAAKSAWNRFCTKPKTQVTEILALLEQVGKTSLVSKCIEKLKSPLHNSTGEILAMARQIIHELKIDDLAIPTDLSAFAKSLMETGTRNYTSDLYSEADSSALNIPVVAPTYSDSSKSVTGFNVVNKFFDITFGNDHRTLAFGEDVGNIGDVNQGFAGLQEKYGVERIFDTGIREWSIIGQAIGLAMRGLRPIAEIQYLDYLVYGLAPMTDDLATLRYRSGNLQMAPAIIRTRGHRLEGIWHAGSPLGMMLGSLRGMYICVPRNFVQAAGMYNTLLKSTDPAVVVEVLNAYRLKETMPDNIGEYTVPLGVPEILHSGSDLTIVTYGACVRYAQEAIDRLRDLPQTIELIDVQTLMPLDLEGVIVNSLKKTNNVLFLDEDVPGGASSYMMQEILENQDGYYHLDGKPRTLTAVSNRTAFGSDGDYFCKPQVEDIVDVLMEMLEA